MGFKDGRVLDAALTLLLGNDEQKRTSVLQ
jgi:hypothetical protein